MLKEEIPIMLGTCRVRVVTQGKVVSICLDINGLNSNFLCKYTLCICTQTVKPPLNASADVSTWARDLTMSSSTPVLCVCEQQRLRLSLSVPLTRQCDKNTNHIYCLNFFQGKHIPFNQA